MDGFKVVLGTATAVFVLIMAFVMSPVFMVGAGEVGVTFNRGTGATHTYSQGAHFRVPVVEAVYKFDVKTQRVDIQAESASKDLQVVHVTAMLNYHLAYDKVNELFQKVGEDYTEKIIQPLTNEVIKAAVAKFPVEQIIVGRDQLKTMIQDELKEKLASYNIALEGVNLVNINFDPEFNKVVEEKQIEEQKIKTAEYKKRQAMETKEQTILEAQATAESQRLLRSNATKEIIDLKWIEKWDGHLPATILGDKSVPMVNLK